MIPIYEDTREQLCVLKERCKHVPPHLHKSVECVFILEGSLVLGIGKELFAMEEGDFAIVFPEQIHHYQIFSREGAKACFLMALPAMSGGYAKELQKMRPLWPVINKEKVHPDIIYAMKMLTEEGSDQKIVNQAFFQIILARAMPCFQLIDKEEVDSDDLVCQTVSYIAANFKDSISLSGMAKELGVSKYVLSRVFSGTFHRNFNQYLNETRLDYACALLEYTNDSVLEIAMESGFESQRTFNRVFRERFKKTPRSYRLDVKGAN